MNWDHRLIDMTAQNNGDPWFEIQEVFYEGERPTGYASVLVGGDDALEVRDTLMRMLVALEKPVLTLTKEGDLK